MGSDDRRLPLQFLAAVATLAEPSSPAAVFAAEQAQVMPGDWQRERLLSGLLSGPFRDRAPEWMLRAAIDQGLKTTESYHAGSSIDLAAVALSHPDSAGDLRDTALPNCTNIQLASLGRADRSAVLTEAVANELRRRSAPPQPMTVKLHADPTPAQVVLGTERLSDAVFDAAFELLPQQPDIHRAHDGERDRSEVDLEAWDTMWERVLRKHPERHAAIVNRAEGHPAARPIHSCLIGSLPWMVEPELLKSLALASLRRFDTVMLTSQACRMLRDGASRREAEARLSSQLNALAPSERRRVEAFLVEDGLDPALGCRAVTRWVSQTADGTWRLLLNPTEAKTRHGQPAVWRASEEELAALGRAFAQTTAPALAMWEPDPGRSFSKLSELSWVADILTRLPRLTSTVKASARSIVTDARQRVSFATYGGRLSQQDRRELDSLIAAIARIVADPLPDAATRAAQLGDPARVTFRALAAVPCDVLVAYLDEHEDDDGLIEKALLAIVTERHRQKDVFAEVLARHSDPGHIIRTMTFDLRRRLGGSPPAREAWAREVLALPGCDADLIRTLPAWTALAVSGNYRDVQHAEIVAVIANGLGSDATAWQRLADSPISENGPNAWLRLGEVLDAARTGTTWPEPPER